MVVKPGSVRAQNVNLTALDVTFQQTEFLSGESFDVEVQVLAEYEGVADADYRVLLVPGRNLTLARELASGTTGPIDAGETFRTTETLALSPDVLGRLDVVLEVDTAAAVAESNEYDNRVYGRQPILVQPRRPDFVVQQTLISRDEAEAGATLELEVVVANQGSAGGDVEVTGRLSTGAGISTDDQELGRRVITLAPNEGLTVALSVTIPDVAAGPYRLGGLVRAVDAEDSDRTNDAGSSRLTIVSSTLEQVGMLADGVVDVPYQAQLDAEGGDGSYVWTLQSGSLPPGLMLRPDGRIRGAPTQSGTFSFAVRVSSRALSDERTYDIEVLASQRDLELAAVALPLGRLGVEYGQRLARSGGEAPFSWSVSQGELPPGVELDGGGSVQGTPEAVGRYEFTVQVQDFPDATASQVYTIEIEPGVAVVVDTAPLPIGAAGESYGHDLVALGGTPPYRWIAESELPEGLELTDGGRLFGEPGEVGTFQFQVLVSDSAPQPARNRSILALTVEDRSAMEIVPPEAQVVRFRESVRWEWTTTGGTPPYTWSLVPGSRLPSNTAFISEEGVGVLEGAPNELGAFGFGVRVEDGAGRRREIAGAIGVRQVDVDSGGGCRGGGTAGLSWVALLLAGLALDRLRRHRWAR